MKETIALAFAATLATTPAPVEQIGDWTIGFGQGFFEYRVQNGQQNSFIISCDRGGKGYGVIMFVEVGGQSPGSHEPVTAAVGETEFTIHTDEDGVGVTTCEACSKAFEGLFEALKSHDRMTVKLAAGASADFATGGGREALPDSCATDFEGPNR
ncbi:MAG: hypothetical protein JJ913_06940 [Rhizobiaceae bacterium]|nr:hypothetical protein [Rhizobiaceae bacterium]